MTQKEIDAKLLRFTGRIMFAFGIGFLSLGENAFRKEWWAQAGGGFFIIILVAWGSWHGWE